MEEERRGEVKPTGQALLGKIPLHVTSVVAGSRKSGSLVNEIWGPSLLGHP